MKDLNVVSYNLNGIRAAIGKGFVDWLSQNDFDVVMIQETKAQKEQVDMSAIEALGYEHHWFSAQKKGYSGVCTLTKIKPSNILYGMGDADFDAEGRTIQLMIGDVCFINCYFPSGSSGDDRQGMKMKFLERMMPFLSHRKKESPNIVLSGDYNICHKAIDIHDPVGNKNTSGFLPVERAWMDQFFDSGFVDVFRKFNQDPHHYTWWSQRFPTVRLQNKGWRIDYHAATESLNDRLLDARIFPDAKHSDHCPIYMKIKM